MLSWEENEKEELETGCFTAVIGHILFSLCSSITLCPAAKVLFPFAEMDATCFLAFGIKNIIPAVPHINVCTDLKMPDIPTGNLA